MSGNEPQCIDEESDNCLDEQDLRIANILAPNLVSELDELPSVSKESIEKYYQHIKKELDKQLLLTGRDSLGYFEWEERFEWGGGDISEFNQLKETHGSYTDQYQLASLVKDDSGEKILAGVVRLSDQKQFYIPLDDLEAGKQDSKAWQILEDYSCWYVNYCW